MVAKWIQCPFPFNSVLLPKKKKENEESGRKGYVFWAMRMFVIIGKKEKVGKLNKMLERTKKRARNKEVVSSMCRG